MKKIFLVFLLVFVAGINFAFSSTYFSRGSHSSSNEDSVKTLKPTQDHYSQAYLIAAILNQHHYSKTQLNDSLSSVIFDNYLNAFDYLHLYFLESDVASLNHYRYMLDDLLLKGNVDIAYDIFEVFKLRLAQRQIHMAKYFESGFDFTREEFLDLEEGQQTWAADIDELHEKWRKVLKSQALNLKLAKKSDEEIERTITERYKRFEKAIAQYNSEDVFQTFMNAVANAYDPHTSYFSPIDAENFEIDMSLSLEGIGARLIAENDYITFTEIMPGGPAFQSGQLKVGDRVVAVAQDQDSAFTNIVGWRSDDAVQLIRGPKGSKVRLKILAVNAPRGAETQEIALIRDEIKLEDEAASKQIVEIKEGDKDYRLGIITIPSFYIDFDALQQGDPNYRSTQRDVRQLLTDLEQEGIDGLIIDLRENGGGSLQEAIAMTGLFIEDGPVVQVKNANGAVDVATDPDSTVLYKGPLAVMINRFSASASEIFAGAIQDYNRGVIIGEQTYGKGTVQNLVDLSSFLSEEDQKLGQIKLTLAKYYRITGSSTQHVGVSPDIALPSLYPADEYGESAQPNALPWDQIAAASFQSTKYVSSQIIEKLRLKYLERLQVDEELLDLAKAIERLEKEEQSSSVSLNEEIRRVEMDKHKEDAPLEPIEDTAIKSEIPVIQGDASVIKDIYLRQGIHLLAEMVAIIG